MNSIKLLKGLQYPSGLFAAAQKTVGTGYDKAWIRDNIYAVLGFEALGDFDESVKVLRALLDVLKKHEFKIDWMIKQPEPKERHRYIHARFHPETFEEFWEEWGNKQNDAIGALLWKIGDLHKKGIVVLRDVDDIRVVQKLVHYLEAIEYWKDEDNGIWEENEEVHASSVGACVAGLSDVADIVDVPLHLIAHGEQVLRELLPRESATKDVDLALLSLIWPYQIVTEKEREDILNNVEDKLVREKGVIRYSNDQYYINGENGKEAEWSMGLCWLAIIFKKLGQEHKYKFYMDKARQALNEKGEMPELYFGGSSDHNENTPLGWAQSLWMVAENA